MSAPELLRSEEVVRTDSASRLLGHSSGADHHSEAFSSLPKGSLHSPSTVGGGFLVESERGREHVFGQAWRRGVSDLLENSFP